MKGGHIGFEHGGRVAGRIDADQHRLHLGGQLGTGFFKLGKALHDALQVDRADVRAIGIAEIDEAILALEVIPAYRFSVLIGKGERAADARAGKVALGCAII